MFKVIHLMALTLLFSCAQMKTSDQASKEDKKKQMTVEEIQAMNKKTLEAVSKRLKELAQAAQKAGPEKVRFLSNDMYLKASAAMMQGDYVTANVIFENLVSLVPQDKFVKKKYSVSLIRTGELTKAKDILIEIVGEKKTYDESIALVLAGVHSSLGEVKESQSIYKTILSKNSENHDACIFLSKSYNSQEKFNLAVKTLKGCFAKNKKEAIYPYYLGKLYVNKAQLKTAQRYFKQSIKIDPEFSQATLALGLVNEEKENYKKAISIYKKYLSKKPNDTMILSRLVQLLFTNEKFKEVIPYAERLSDYDPENLNLKVKLGILYADVQDFDKAIAVFKDLLSFAPDNDKLLYYLGAIYQEVKSYEEAINYFVQIPPKSGLYHDSSLQVANMLNTLAQNEYLLEGKDKKWQKKFISFVDGKINELPKLQVDFASIKAVFYENIQFTEKAIAVLDKVKDQEDFGSNNLYHLASLHEKIGNHSESIEIMMSIVKLDPNDAHAWNFIGYSLIERGEEMDRAYEYIKKAVDLRPEDGYIRDSLGWYYYKIGKVKKSLGHLKQAVGLVPDDISIQKHLAIVYSNLKDFKMAKHHLLKAIDLTSIESEKKELANFLKSIEAKRVPASFLEK